MNNNQLVNVCVICAHTNESKGTGFPLICPRLNMPCFAIHPDYILNNQKELIKVTMSNDGRLPLHYADKDFLKHMKKAYHELLQKNIDVTKGTIY